MAKSAAKKKTSDDDTSSRVLSDAEQAMVARFREALGEERGRALQVARAAGVDHSTVYRFRDGKRIPEVPVLVRLADALDVSIGWLVGGEGPRERVAGALADALAQSVAGFDLRMRDSGLNDWMKRQPPHKVPSVKAALSALDAYDAARASGALLLHSADGRPVMDWASFFARSTAPQDAPTTTRNVLDEAEAGQPLRLIGPAKKSTKPKR